MKLDLRVSKRIVISVFHLTLLLIISILHTFIKMLQENRSSDKLGAVYALQRETIFNNFFVAFELLVLLL